MSLAIWRETARPSLTHTRMSLKSVPSHSPRWVSLFWHHVPSLTPFQPVLNEDGTSSGTTETEIPFNLDILRKHLAHVSLARRVLSEDLAARQKLLEDSVFDVAVQRMRRQAEVLKDLGLGDSILKKQDLQLWMWQWHQLLQDRLRDDIAQLIKEESSKYTWSES